jgi:hypothetical protein
MSKICDFIKCATRLVALNKNLRALRALLGAQKTTMFVRFAPAGAQKNTMFVRFAPCWALKIHAVSIPRLDSLPNYKGVQPERQLIIAG